MTDMDMPLPTLPSMPPELMAYIDRFDGAEYGLVMIAIQRFAAAAAAKERERCAALCESCRDLKEEARAILAAATALQEGGVENMLGRLRHESMVRLMNDALAKAAAAIRAGSPGTGPPSGPE